MEITRTKSFFAQTNTSIARTKTFFACTKKEMTRTKTSIAQTKTFFARTKKEIARTNAFSSSTKITRRLKALVMHYFLSKSTSRVVLPKMCEYFNSTIINITITMWTSKQTFLLTHSGMIIFIAPCPFVLAL